MRVTVTGATGFIGAQLVDRLIADGHHITALVRRRSSIPALRLKGVAAVAGDVDDPVSLRSAMTGSDVVFHLARAKAHGTRPREAFVVNVEGSGNAARAAVEAGVERFVHASSAAVYGSRAGLVNEHSVVRPDSAYARSKADAENLVTATCGKRAVIARITSVLGKGARSWIPLLTSATTGKLRLIGDGSNMHHPADVSEILDGLVACGFTPGVGGRTFNLAGPEPVTILELRAILASSGSGGLAVKHPRPYPQGIMNLYYRLGVASDSAFGVRLPLFESVMFITGHRILDLARARDELGFVPSVGVSDAAARTVDSLRREGLLA